MKGSSEEILSKVQWKMVAFERSTRLKEGHWYSSSKNNTGLVLGSILLSVFLLLNLMQRLGMP